MLSAAYLEDYFIPKEVTIDHRWLDVNGKSRQISILRLDAIHPITGGNKTFKLFENIKQFYKNGFDGIVSVGGQYSNHIAALAQVGKDLSIPIAGIIRGVEPDVPTHTIQQAKENGMEIVYVAREKYRQMRKQENPCVDFSNFENFMFIPEGGGNELGVEGCKHIAQYIPSEYTHILLAVGTGATLKGLSLQTERHQKIIGIKVLEARQEEYVFEERESTVNEFVRLNSDFTFGGYAKKSPFLDDFVGKWNENQNILIEPIYTGRLFFAVQQLLQQDYFPENAKIIVIHSGGMQYFDH
ncbi:MAG: pyridoxal-phosphate dependent enzyme [Bacteroidetes bacterium]|nr:pyridoxal-phosphate dependent enzyme [Bacteroidota bacterium]